MPLRCTVSPFIDTIIGREGHWQSRVLRNDLNSSRISRPIRSLSGQLLKMRPLTRGSVRTISGNMFSLVISETYWRRGRDSQPQAPETQETQ
jgi:hypothetical protein